MKKEIIVLILSICGLFVLGSIIPALLTAQSNIAVFIGVCMVIVAIYFAIRYFKPVKDWFIKEFDIKIVAMLCILPLLASCGYTKVPAGYEGVKVNSLGDDKGAITTIGVGRHFYPIKYNMYKFPLYKQNYVWSADSQEGSRNNESITFQSKQSLTFNADVGISYSVKPGRSGKIYETYHKKIAEITDVDMRNSVRDAFNRLACVLDNEYIYGAGKAKFIESVENDVSEYWKDNITIHKVYLIGEMRVPLQVKKAIGDKIAATQRAQQKRNEVLEAAAEADKQIEKSRGKAESIKQEADADAYAIKAVQDQLKKSPQYISYIKATRWDGKLPLYNGSGVLPMIDIGK